MYGIEYLDMTCGSKREMTNAVVITKFLSQGETAAVNLYLGPNLWNYTPVQLSRKKFQGSVMPEFLYQKVYVKWAETRSLIFGRYCEFGDH